MIIRKAIFACEGRRIEIGPGGFNFMPAGALAFITIGSARDVNWVEGPPTTADISR